MNRKILIVTYHFPPSPAVGGIRPAKFAKYLPEFGWTPFVLTIREESVKNPDPKRLTELAGTRIARSAVWPNLVQLLNRLKRGLLPKWARGGHTLEFPNSAEQYAALKDGFLVNKVSQLKKFLKSVFELPDQQVGWLVPAVAEGYRLLRRERFDLIYATAPQETATLVAYALSRLSGTKLLLDFRDPCFSHNQKHFSHAVRFSYGMEQWMSEKIIRRAATFTARRSTGTCCIYGIRKWKARRSPSSPMDSIPKTSWLSGRAGNGASSWLPTSERST
jgi:hypothetical protein